MSSSHLPLVTLDNAGIYRDGRWLVRGISLSVQRGEIVTLIGPNGSGKSTTAKLSLGVIKPDEGTATRAATLKVGYVPQKLAIDWTLPLKVERFVKLTGQLDGPAVTAALEATGVSHLRNAQVRSLSGGEFQRVMLARAIARKPNFLVLDEPVQGVDFAGEIQLYDLIKSIRDQLDCGVLLISHDLHVVMAATDKVLCLNGHVCCSGTPTAVASSDVYRDLFGARATAALATPALATPALAIYEHSHDHTHLPDGRVQHDDGSITDHCHADDGHHDHGDKKGD